MLRIKPFAIGLGLSGIALVVALGVAEIAIRVFGPQSDRYLVLPPEYTVVYEPTDQVHGVVGPSVYSTNSDGVRGPQLSSDADYRILAIGGSTTQNSYLDQDESWSLLLGPRLSSPARTVWSGDIGQSGHTTRQHLLHVRYFAPQIPELDAVIMLIGINDLASALREEDRYTPRPPLENEGVLARSVSEVFISLPGGLHDSDPIAQLPESAWYKRTALYGLARTVRRGLERQQSDTQPQDFGDPYRIWRQNRAASDRIHEELPDMALPLRDYLDEVSAIVEETSEAGYRLILATAPALWRDDLTAEEEALLWVGGVGPYQQVAGQPYYSPGALATGLDMYNSALLAMCSEEGLECVDVAARIPPDTTMFLDDVHFTERGSKLVADVLLEYLESTPPLAASR